MSIKRRKKNGVVYLEQYKSIRIGNKIKSVYVKSLGPENPKAASTKPRVPVLERLEHFPSHRAGDVTILWEIAKENRFVEILDGICCGQAHIEGISPGKLLTAWAINRVVDPTSATKLERWIPTTDLPRLMDANPADFSKDAFLSSLDFICREDRTANRFIDNTVRINDYLYQDWRKRHPLSPMEKETVAYDMTSVLFFGVKCPLAEYGHNSDEIQRPQVNMALAVSRTDKYPIGQFVFSGKRHPASTLKNLLTWLVESSIDPGTIIWDRGNVSEEHIKAFETVGWKVICGIPLSNKEASEVVKNTEIPLNPETYIQKSRTGHIYAVKTDTALYGQNHSVVVYVNQERRNNLLNDQNEVLVDIGKQLNDLNEKGKGWSESKLHDEIDKIIGTKKKFFSIRVSRKVGSPRIKWEYRKRVSSDLADAYGKYLLFSSDDSIPANEVIQTYFEKDYIEKVFRTMKSSEELEPVRHRLENRVRAYLFLCSLAYRLEVDLLNRFRTSYPDSNAWEQLDEYLFNLSRVARTQIRFGQQVKTYFLNISKKMQEISKKIGFQELFQDIIEVQFRM